MRLSQEVYYQISLMLDQLRDQSGGWRQAWRHGRRGSIQRKVPDVHRVIEAGVPMAGYFAWSHMDNLGWTKKQEQRFSIVWVDFDTLIGIPRDSAKGYKYDSEEGILVNKDSRLHCSESLSLLPKNQF